MLHFVLGAAGCGKSEYLINRIAEAEQQGCLVRTLVPEPFCYTYDKRLYAHLGAVQFNQLRTGSFRFLTQEILSEIASAPRDAADAVTKTVLLHTLLRRLSNGHVLLFYGGQAERASFLPQIEAQLNEMMQAGALPEDLADAAAAMQSLSPVLSQKVTDIARIYADYLTLLAENGLRDILTDPVTAAAAADGGSFFAGAHIFLDEFESFTGDQYKMLEIMLRDAAEVWIALRTDNMDAPDFTRFDAVNDTARTLRRLAKEQNTVSEVILLTEQHRFAAPSLAYLSRGIYTVPQIAYAGEDCAVTICEAADRTLEAEYCAAQIRQLLMQGKLRASDIMVVMHDIGSYGALLEAAFERYGIPYYMDQRRSVLHTAVMKLPLCLLALLHKTTTEQLLLLLHTQMLLQKTNDAARLEDYAYIWDIEGTQWERPFAAETDPEGKAEALRQRIMQPILAARRSLSRKDGETVTGEAILRTLYRLMTELHIPDRAVEMAGRMRDRGDLQRSRTLRGLWKSLMETLDAMHEALRGVTISLPQLSDLMTAVLRSHQLPEVPQTLDAVTVQSAAAARYDSPKAVFVLGVNEGAFPANISQTGFFSEAEREQLSGCGVELSRSVRDLCADERLIVYKTLSAASEMLWLCYPLADEKGSALIASPLLTEVQTLLPQTGKPPFFHHADRMGALFFVSSKAAAYYSFVQDYELSPVERASVRQMLSEMPQEAARLNRLRQHSGIMRLRAEHTELIRQLSGGQLYMSATEIENKMRCPFMSFCKDDLRLYKPEKKNLNPLSVGTMVHNCMERLFREHPDRDGFLAMSAAELHDHAQRCAADFMEKELGGRENRPARFLQQYDRIAARLTGLLRHTQKEMAQSAFEPKECELVIGQLGDEKGTAPYMLTLSNGIQLCLRGKIDRVDLTEHDGEQYLRIVDYKTGIHKKEFKLANIYYGLNLQMLLYLFALTDDPDAYPDAKPAGVLYMPADEPDAQSRESMKPTAEYFSAYFRMSGTVLLDRGVLSKMEAEIAGVYIPAKLAASDTGTGEPVLDKDSQVFTAQQLAGLRVYIEKLVRQCAECYTEGDIVPSPMQGGSAEYFADACRYCDYRSICFLSKQDAGRIRRPLPQKEANAAMLKIMNNNGEEVQENELDTAAGSSN